MPTSEMLPLALLYLSADFALHCSHVSCCGLFCQDSIWTHPELKRAVSASWLLILV